jgi:hypothetical protein
MTTRDPRTDPRPGDLLASGHALVRVDQVALGRVLCAVFRDDAQQPHTITSLPLLEWVLATINSRVVALPEGDPRLTATILGAT